MLFSSGIYKIQIQSYILKESKLIDLTDSTLTIAFGFKQVRAFSAFYSLEKEEDTVVL